MSATDRGRPIDARRLEWLLRVATAATLVGHGGYGWAMAKPAWVGYFGALGVGPAVVRDASLVPAVGLFEIGLGLLVLVRPFPTLLLLVVLWKVGTELLRPLAGEPLWEVVERWSNYTAPLALLYVRGWPKTARQWLGPTPPDARAACIAAMARPGGRR